MIEQYAFNIKEIGSIDEVSQFINIISDKRRKKIDRFIFMKDKVQGLFAEIILRYALLEQYSIHSLDIEFEYTEYGKPGLANYRDIHFNMTHSGNWVLCGVGDTSLGVDVEQIKEKQLSMANKMYTKEENDFIHNQLQENRLKAFYKIWTLKESYVKNIGKGLSIPFDSFSFSFYQDEIQFYQQGKRNDSFSFNTGQLDDQHITALCVDSKWSKKINEKVKVLTLEELIKSFNAII